MPFLLALVLLAPATLGGNVLSASDIVLFSPPFPPQPAGSVPENPLQFDSAFVFEPDGLLVGDALREGRLPLWAETLSTGRPLLAAQQSAPLYPLTWIGVVFPRRHRQRRGRAARPDRSAGGAALRHPNAASLLLGIRAVRVRLSIVVAVVVSAALFLPGAALAQSAGDEQYSDPFGAEEPQQQEQPAQQGQSQQPAEPVEPAPTESTAPAGGSSGDVAAAPAPSGGSTLPATGLPALSMLVVGGLMFATGAVVRRRL